MSGWTLNQSSPTKDPRVRVGEWGKGNWRTLVQDEPAAGWNETGPSYPTKTVALGHVDDVLADYFGELPTRGLLAERIERALVIARKAYPLAQYRDQPALAGIIAALSGDREDPPVPAITIEDLDISVTRPDAVPHGSGGQTTGEYDPYVRITHKPTGVTVARDSERSQLMNKAAALEELRRLLAGRYTFPDLEQLANAVAEPACYRSAIGALVHGPGCRCDDRLRPAALGIKARYPGITVSTVGDLFENATLIERVSSALLKGGATLDEVQLFEDEAGEFTGYLNVLRTARAWVTVTS